MWKPLNYVTFNDSLQGYTDCFRNYMQHIISSVFFRLAHITDCSVLRTLAILRKFAPVSIGTLCSFPLSVQFNALLLVLVTVSHKNTPNTGCPVLGVHINCKWTCSSSSFRFRLCAKISHVHIQAFLHKLYYTIPQPYHMAYWYSRVNRNYNIHRH